LNCFTKEQVNAALNANYGALRIIGDNNIAIWKRKINVGLSNLKEIIITPKDIKKFRI